MDPSGHSENRFAVPSAMAYSKADRILSRYRPIAPKPLLPKTDSDLQSASSVTSEGYSKSSTSGENTLRRRRSRKRTSDAMALPSNPKRIPSVVESEIFDGMLNSNKLLSFPQTIDDNVSRAELAHSQAKTFIESNVSFSALDHTFSSFSRESFGTVVCSYGGVNESKFPLRRAALDTDNGISKYQCNAVLSSMDGGECRPMFDYRAFMPKAAKMYPAEKNVADVRETSKLHFSEKSWSSSAFALPSSFSESCSLGCNLGGSTGCSTYTDDDSLQLQSHEENNISSSSISMRTKDLVTLSLLPDTPLRECPNLPLQPTNTTPTTYPQVSSTVLLDDRTSDQMIQLSLSTRTDEEHGDDRREDKASAFSFSEKRPLQDVAENEGVERLKLATVMEADGGASFHQVWAQYSASNGGSSSTAPVIDSSYLEQTYMASCDPVLLTDECHRILWSNVSFKKAISERMSRKLQESGAYIDHLGVPTGLACFTYLLSASSIPSCRAVLWGFLKKMVFQKPAFSGMNTSERLSSPKEDDASEGKPIVPQPIRPVRSTIYLECITEINRLVSLPRLLDIAKEHIELSALPSLLSNPRNSVLWVNAAYKKMVGQQQQQQQQQSFEFSDPENSRPCLSRPDEDVSFVFLNDHPPLDAASFSGRARLHWLNAGDNRSTTVPCHVKKIHDKVEGSLFLWTFHVGAVDHLGGSSGWN